MKNIAGLMKQATQMQARMKEAQEKLAALSVTGEAGAGLVQLTLTGKGDLGGIKIDPKILNPEDAETLQDLICEAYGAAREKIRVANEEEMKKVTGGLSLPPGMELPFG